MKNFNTLKKYPFFFITLLITISIWIAGTNTSLFFKINALHGLLPDSVWNALNTLTSPANGFLALTLLILTFLFRREKWLNVLLLIVSYYVIFQIVKMVVHSPRPYALYNLNTFFWIPLSHHINTIVDHQSFPSGHVGNAAIFTFASIRLFAENKMWLRILFVIFLMLTVFARICTGWHFPLDVLAAILISFILTQICWRIPLRKSQKRI